MRRVYIVHYINTSKQWADCPQTSTSLDQRSHVMICRDYIREIHLARSEKFICLKLKNPKSLPVRIDLHPNSLVARLQQLQQPSGNTLMLPILYSITLYHPCPRIHCVCQSRVTSQSVMRKSKSNRKLLLFDNKTPTSPPLFEVLFHSIQLFCVYVVQHLKM